MGKDRRFYPLMPKPGIKRDGSENEGSYFINGNWIRFQRGLAETMGGITSIDNLFFKNRDGKPPLPDAPGNYIESKEGNYLTNMKAFSWKGENYLFVSYTSFNVGPTGVIETISPTTGIEAPYIAEVTTSETHDLQPGNAVRFFNTSQQVYNDETWIVKQRISDTEFSFEINNPVLDYSNGGSYKGELNIVGFYIFKYFLNDDPNQSFSYQDFIHYNISKSSNYPYLYDTYFLFEGPFSVDTSLDLTEGVKKYIGDYFYVHLVADSSDVLENRKSSLYLLDFLETAPNASLSNIPSVFSNLNVFDDYNFNGGIREQEGLFVSFGNGYFVYSKYPDFRESIVTTKGGEEIEATFIEPLSGTNQKTLQAHFTRGGTNAPTILFWSLASVIKAINVSNDNEGLSFKTDIVSNNCSLMSRDSVVEYDGLFFWMGVDRFFLYNGTVQELPNSFNQNEVFENLDFSQRQNVIGAINSKYGEIWWFYPDRRFAPKSIDENNITTSFDGNTAAVIYNKREDCWYSLQNINRDCISFSSENGFFFCGGCDDYLQAGKMPVEYDFNKNYQQIYIQDTLLMKKKVLVFDQVNKTSAMDFFPIETKLETPFFSWRFMSPGGQVLGANQQINLISVEPDVTFMTRNGYTQFWNNDDFVIEIKAQTKKFLMKKKATSSEIRYIKPEIAQLTYSNTSSSYINFVLSSTAPYRLATFLIQFEFDGEK